MENDHYVQFSKYLTKECFTDVTLVSDDLWKFPSHRIVLSAASPVLESLLMSNMQMNDSHTIIPLRGYNKDEVQGLLNIIYSKKSANDIPLDSNVKRLLEELNVMTFDMKVPSREKELTSVHKIREEFDILNKSNLAIETIKPLESVTSTSTETEVSLKIEDERNKALTISCNSLTLKSIGHERESETETSCKLISNHTSNIEDTDESTIILEGQECSIVNDADDNYEINTEEILHHGDMNRRNKGDDGMIVIISDSKPTFECALCDSSFHINTYRKRHERSHQGEQCICKTCKKEFQDLHGLKKHYDSKHQEPRYKCKKCDFKSGSKNVVRNHLKYHKDATFACDMCDKSFREKFRLKVHKQIHLQDHERYTFECDRCYDFFPSKSTLNSHIKIVHDLVRYPCSMCPFQASSRVYLRKHEEGYHQGITYDCNLCDYRGKVELSLKNHIKIEHEGLRFYCDECPEQYRRKGQLQKHKVKKHGQEKSRRSHNKAIYQMPYL